MITPILLRTLLPLAVAWVEEQEEIILKKAYL
jgi:hypothetical protein